MRKIYIFDTTLRDGEQSPGVNLNTQEKVEIALQLEKLGVDRMEAGFPAASPGDLAALMLLRELSRMRRLSACPVPGSRILMLFAKRLRALRIRVFICSWRRRRSTASISCGWRSSRCWKQLKRDSLCEKIFQQNRIFA